MKDVLEEIIASKRPEVAELRTRAREIYSAAERAVDSRNTLDMAAALRGSDSGIIAEFKRKSPSKGWINQQADPRRVAPAYANAGASALSILTDGPYFGGSLEFLKEVRPLVNIPLLRKEFIIDELQLFEARAAGADAVLLIAAALTPAQAHELARQARQLGLQVLLEVHSEPELDHVCDHVDMVGVNNRNLGTFHTDVQNSFRLAQSLPPEFTLVSESGLARPETVAELRRAGFRGFLIGETFMKTADPAQTLKEFISGI